MRKVKLKPNAFNIFELHSPTGGWNSNFNDYYDSNLLIKAIDNDSIEEIVKHIEEGGDINASHKEIGTALIYAAKKSRDTIAKLLVKYNADINAQDKEGFTALYHYVDNNGRAC
jgi:ankyrin repeat protein